MKTRVFLSWSGEKSKRVAGVFRSLLPAVLQSADPFFSPDDIDKGRRWATELAGELESASVGIVFLTRDNLTAPWILFETGALSKQLSSANVCTLLVDVKLSDVSGPLSQFQHCTLERADLRQLFSTINSASSSSALQESVLDAVFDQWWESFREKIEVACEDAESSKQGVMRTDREMLEEILLLSRHRTIESAVLDSLRLQAAQLEAIAVGLLNFMRMADKEQREMLRPSAFMLVDVLRRIPNSDKVTTGVIEALLSVSTS